MSDKKVHLKIDRNSSSVTLEDILKEMERIQKENPHLDVYFDGDEYAICSKPLSDPRPRSVEAPKKPARQSPIDTVGEGEFDERTPSAAKPAKKRSGKGSKRKGVHGGKQGSLASLADDD